MENNPAFVFASVYTFSFWVIGKSDIEDELLTEGKRGLEVGKRPLTGFTSVYFCSLGGFDNIEIRFVPEKSPIFGFTSAYLRGLLIVDAENNPTGFV